MGSVFLSYSRADAAWVTLLVARLEHRGHTAWVDQRDIPASLPWLAEVRDAILESDVFVICDSPAARNSMSCSAESAFAAEAAKQACTVAVHGEVADAEHIVAEALLALTPAYLARTELAVLSRDWERAGRPRGSLVSARHRRRLSAGTRVPPALRRDERAFLRASRARSRRRLAATAALALLAGGSVLAFEGFKAARERITLTNKSEAEAFIVEKQQLQNVTTLPFQGLAEAAQSGNSEAAVHAVVISEALRYRVPDDAFTVPAAATGFAPQAGGMVTVIDRKGHAWGRVATATAVRAASPVAPSAGRVSRASAGDLRFRERRSTGVVEVLRKGYLWRTILYDRTPSALALSPDGRELAAGVGDTVEVADLEHGAVRTVLRGAPEDVHDLMWAPNGARLWALTTGMAISWPVRDGTVLVDEPAHAFEAILPSSHPDAVWIVARDGELRELDFTSGKTIAKLHVPDTIDSAGGSPDGRVAALSGVRGEWIIPLSKSSPPRLLTLPRCGLGRPVLPDTSIVYVPCLSSVLLTVSVPHVQVVARTTLDQFFGVDAVKVVPRTGTLLVGDDGGHLFEGSPSSGFHQIWASGCGASILRIGIAPNRSAFTTAGSGTGTAGCSARGLRVGGPAGSTDWQVDAVDDPSLPSILAESVAFSNGGHVFAYGFSDGTIDLHPTANVLPILTLTTIDGAIRDMYVTPDDELLVATDAGIIQRIPLCDSCLNDRYLARRAATERARGTELRLAHSVQHLP